MGKYGADYSVGHFAERPEDINPMCLKPALKVEFCGYEILGKRDSKKPHIFSCIR